MVMVVVRLYANEAAHKITHFAEDFLSKRIISKTDTTLAAECLSKYIIFDDKSSALQLQPRVHI